MSSSKRESSQTVTFDRVADIYDATRTLSPKTMAAIVARATPLLQNRGPCLEIGVGTGRIAVPLHEAGVDLVGIDVSGPMLAKLAEKGAGRPPFAVARADSHSLPFRDAVFGSGLVVHVLHLLEDWRRALDELARVVRGGGVLLVDLGRGSVPTGSWAEVQDRFVAAAGISDHKVFLQETAAVDAYLQERGELTREDAILETRAATFREVIDRLERGVYSYTWTADHHTRARAADVARTWVREHYGGLDQMCEYEIQVVWRVCELKN